MTEHSYQWLQSLPIQPVIGGSYVLADGQRITTTFLRVANAMVHKGLPLEAPPEPIRSALAHYLRHRYHPDKVDGPPWIPTADRYHPFRGSIEPLLASYLWQQSQVIAAPFTLYLPNQAVAGSADAVIALADGSLAIATLLHAEPKPLLKHRVTTLLGGFIAAAIDTRAFAPAHGMAIWCSCGQTLIETFSPDLCLGRWVETFDFYKSVFGNPVLTNA
jgi:hypothetical protein